MLSSSSLEENMSHLETVQYVSRRITIITLHLSNPNDTISVSSCKHKKKKNITKKHD